MPLDYTVYTRLATLPATASIPVVGNRLYWLKGPGVKVWNDDGTARETCLAEVEILQHKSRNDLDDETYYLEEATRNDLAHKMPPALWQLGAAGGFWFINKTSEPTPDRPGVYLVVCDRAGLPLWCSCLGAVGHKQNSNCKHRDVIADLATHPIEVSR